MKNTEAKAELKSIGKALDKQIGETQKQVDYLQREVVQKVDLQDDLASFESLRDRVLSVADQLGADAPEAKPEPQAPAPEKAAEKK